MMKKTFITLLVLLYAGLFSMNAIACEDNKEKDGMFKQETQTSEQAPQ